MAEGITTRLQRELNQTQQDLSKLQSEVQQLDKKLDDKFESLRNEIKIELKSFLDLLTTKGRFSVGKGVTSESSSHGGIEVGDVSQGHTDLIASLLTPTRFTHEDGGHARFYKYECPRFAGDNFKGWLMKLEQYFEAEKVPEAAKVRTVMLNLEGRALKWHHYFAKLQGGIEKPSWVKYLTEMRDRFAPNEFDDLMAKLVALRQTGLCKQVYWLVQGVQFTTDFMVLPLKGCDVVLGVQWLATLGPILWDFTTLTMQFQVGLRWLTLQGIQTDQIHMLNSKQGSKLLASTIFGSGPHLCVYVMTVTP